MLRVDAEKRIKEIEKEIVKAGIIDAPGGILVGFGVYAKFVANGDAFLSFLNNQTNVNIMLVIGASLMAWGAYKFITLSLEKNRLKDEHGI